MSHPVLWEICEWISVPTPDSLFFEMKCEVLMICKFHLFLEAAYIIARISKSIPKLVEMDPPPPKENTFIPNIWHSNKPKSNAANYSAELYDPDLIFVCVCLLKLSP